MLDHLLLPIQKHLREVESILACQHQSAVPLITDAAEYVTQNGGKRIRPAIFLLATKMVGVTDERIPHLAAAIELVHTASLLHDDVVDNAALRRGKPSANIKWGNQVSVLVGDFLWCKASELFIKYGNNRLWNAITKTISQITEGQILEITKLNDINIDEAGYHQIISGKTASLFSICSQGAAIIQNLSNHFEDALHKFGFNLGLAFQLTDDVLDYTSNDRMLGKKAGADLREGKLTLPMIIALKRSSPKEKQMIKESLISGQISEGQFSDILGIIHQHKGFEETSRLAKRYADQAKESISIFKPSIERTVLWGLSNYVVDRSE